MKRLLCLILGLSLYAAVLPAQAQVTSEVKPINLIFAFDISGSMYQQTEGLGRWPDQALRLFYSPNTNRPPLVATDPNNRRFDAVEAALRWLQVYQKQHALLVNVSAFAYRQSPPGSSVDQKGSKILNWRALDSMTDDEFKSINSPPPASDYSTDRDIRADYEQALEEANALASARRGEESVVIFITDSIHCPYASNNMGCTSAGAVNNAIDNLTSAKSKLHEYYVFIGPGGDAQRAFEEVFSQQTERFKNRAATSGGKFLHVAGVDSVMDGIMGVILREVARAKGLSFDKLGEDPVRDDFSALGVYRWATREAVVPPYQVRLNAIVSTRSRNAGLSLKSANQELSIEEPHGRDKLARFIQVKTPKPGRLQLETENDYFPTWVSYEAARVEVLVDPPQIIQYQRQRLIYLILDGNQAIANADYQPILRAAIEGARRDDRLELNNFSFERYGHKRQPAFVSEPFLLTKDNLDYSLSWEIQVPNNDKWPSEVSYSFLNVSEEILRPKPISFRVSFEANTDISDDTFARSYPLNVVLSAEVDRQAVPLPEGLRAELQLETIANASNACPTLSDSERQLRRQEDGLRASRQLRFDVDGQCQISLALTLEDDLLRIPDKRLSLASPRNVPRTFTITPTQRLDIGFVQTRFEAQGFPIFTERLSPNEIEVTLEIQDIERGRERVRGVFNASETPFGLEILNANGDDLAKARGLTWTLKDDGTYRFTIGNLPPGRYVVNATFNPRAQSINLDRYEYDPSLPDEVVRQAEIEVSFNTLSAISLVMALGLVALIVLVLWNIFQRRRAALSGYLVIYKTQGDRQELLWWRKLKRENTQRFGDTDFTSDAEKNIEMARLNIEALEVSTRREFGTARRRQAYVNLMRGGQDQRNELVEEDEIGMLIHETKEARYVLSKVKDKPDPNDPATFVVARNNQ